MTVAIYCKGVAASAILDRTTGSFRCDCCGKSVKVVVA